MDGNYANVYNQYDVWPSNTESEGPGEYQMSNCTGLTSASEYEDPICITQRTPQKTFASAQVPYYYTDATTATSVSEYEDVNSIMQYPRREKLKDCDGVEFSQYYASEDDTPLDGKSSSLKKTSKAPYNGKNPSLRPSFVAPFSSSTSGLEYEFPEEDQKRKKRKRNIIITISVIAAVLLVGAVVGVVVWQVGGGGGDSDKAPNDGAGGEGATTSAPYPSASTTQPSPTSNIPTPSILQFDWIDGASDTVYQSDLQPGQDIKQPAPRNWNIKIDRNSDCQSMQIYINGVYNKTENYAPFAVCPDAVGDYAPCDWPHGYTYTVKVVPYSMQYAYGLRGPSKTLVFSIPSFNTFHIESVYDSG